MKNEEQKVAHRFTSIETYQEEKHAKNLENAWIVIREKIDGSNLQIENVNGKLRCGSREFELTADFNLSNAYQYVQQLDPKKFEEGKIYFGEWITPFRLNYKKDNNTVRLFAVVESKKTGSHSTFLDKERTDMLIEKTGLVKAPVLYEGPFQSMEHIQSFVGQTKMVQPLGWIENDVPKGEGVVVYVYEKDKKTLKENNGKPCLIKFVIENFKERKLTPKKTTSKNDSELVTFLTETVTEARMNKKFLDQVTLGLYPLELERKDMGKVMQNLPMVILEDVVSENQEEYEGIFERYVAAEEAFLKENVSEEKAKSVEKDATKKVNKLITEKVLKFVNKKIK